MSKRKVRMGRPPFAEGVAKAVLFSMRLAPSEREAIEEAAERAEMSASEWAREALIAASKKH